MKTSWKTSVAGIITALGAALQQSTEPLIHSIGQFLLALGPLLLGLSARDHNVSSEKAGLKD